MSINFIAAFGTFVFWALVMFAYFKYDDWKQSKNQTTE